MPLTNQKIQLAERPSGLPSKDTFHFADIPIDDPKLGEVLVKTLYVSVDPYMRGRMENVKSYVEPFELHEPINGGVIGEVVKSHAEKFQEGDIITGNLPWQHYSIASEVEVRSIDPEAAPLTAHLGILGMPGLTAYFGMTDIGSPKEGETVVVSGGAGAVGSAAGQIAKISGARVVGIAGSNEKTALMRELGFDETINYRTEKKMSEAIKRTCPNGVDVYFDNVGGEISDVVLNRLNTFARIVQCGAIASYNVEGEDIGPRVQTKLIKSSALMKGFIVADYASRFQEGARQLGQWLNEGKLKYEETIVEGFENIPDAFLGLFRGENTGKQIVKTAETEHNS
ncbi:NADP-dependent oxidoreductase [Alteribacillus sp. HJP-4]|uniref:NADP-dependent oxidoreductase n=1 Tax=Alteribacillus sp. HJP-4 TaxID=2775394 RepID=UPI0035CCF6B9